MLDVLSHVGRGIIGTDVDPSDLDKNIESAYLKLTRKPSRRNPHPQPSNLWTENFVRRKRRGRSKTSQTTGNKRSKRSRAKLSTASDKRINNVRRKDAHCIKTLQDNQQKHVKCREDAGSVCCQADDEHTCSICLHSTTDLQGSDVARLDCFHEFCRPGRSSLY